MVTELIIAGGVGAAFGYTAGVWRAWGVAERRLAERDRRMAERTRMERP